jgi:hypothetical protein
VEKLRIKNIMIRLMIYCALLIALPLISVAQSGIELKIHYEAETDYQQLIVMKSNSIIKYSGSEEVLNYLIEIGIDNPTEQEQNIIIETLFSTGKEDSNGIFPVEIEYVNSDNGQGEKIVPNGTKIFGIASAKEKPSLHSISSTDLTEEYKQTLLQAIQNLISQINFPEKYLEIGESFELITPLTIPIADANIDMIITSNYKLNSIENNLANFEIKQDIAMISDILQYQTFATGKGIGLMAYDINFNNISELKTEMEMTISMDLEGIIMNVQQKSTTIQKYTFNRK